MNRLVLETDVQTIDRPDGIKMRISLKGAGRDAANRMVTAHGPVLAAETGWMSDVSFGDEVIDWTVTGEGDHTPSRIKALGFYGLMATGDHHRTHHFAIARGKPMH